MSTITEQMDATAHARSLVREFMAEGLVDPHDIAAKVANVLTRDELAEIAASLLSDLARKEIRAERNRPGRYSDVLAGRKSRKAGPSRMRVAGDVTRNEPSRHLISVPGGWKPLADCTADDLDASADQYFVRAESNRRQGERYRRLAEKMRESGATTVADLPEDFVAEVLS